MRRTQSDLEDLTQLERPSVRIVKGAYNEPSNVAYKSPRKLTPNYLDLVETALNRINGRVAIATHDESMLQRTLELTQSESATDNYEFQMLMGVREDRQRELAQTEQIAQYVPYGSEWASYTYRRIRENPKKTSCSSEKPSIILSDKEILRTEPKKEY